MDQSYQQLPSDLCSHCVRTSSQPSPYPQSQVSKITISLDQTCPSFAEEVQKAALKLSNPFHPCFLDVEPKRENAMV